MDLKRERMLIWPGAVGAIAFGLTWTAVQYFLQRELTLLGVVGGAAWFLTSLWVRHWVRERGGEGRAE